MTSLQTNPFNKYLFSGAFYIQAANCFRPAMEWVDNRDSAKRDALQTMLQNSWLETAMNYSTSNLSTGLLNVGSIPKNAPFNFSRLTQILNRIAPKMVDEFIDQVSEYADNNMTFEVFFSIWTETCSKTYVELINSEEFIDCLTDSINLLIKTSTELANTTTHKNE